MENKNVHKDKMRGPFNGVKIFNFLKYNNAVPIMFGVVFLGASGAFAATNPQAILSTDQTVTSVDNTYIAAKDLSTWTPQIGITGVTEDADNYYVAYQFVTIDVVDYIWRDVTKTQTMTVSKAALGPNDLGVYVTGQFYNIIHNEVAYLGQVQDKAKADTTQKTVATAYGGLIGKFLNSSTDTLPGYTPVVTPPVADNGGDQGAAAAGSGSSGGPGQASSGGSGGSSSLMSLQILGNNPAQVALGGGYIDLGVVLLDPQNPNLGYHAFVDGKPMDPPQIDTSTTSVHIIEYRATDQAGNNLLVRRIVLVGGAADPGGEINTAGTGGAAMPGAVVIFDTATTTPDVATTTPDVATTTLDTATTTPPVDTTPPPDTSTSTPVEISAPVVATSTDTTATTTDTTTTDATTTTP